jgi:predicted nucleic-acid-binding Zn-ribbon protein
MSEQPRKCVKCDGEMKEGLAVALGERFFGTNSPFWMELKIRDYVRLPHTSDDVEKYAIATYRCVKCGYLESYATERQY